MNFLEEFSKTLSDISGISQTPILLITYSIISIIIIELISKGIIFLNTQLIENERNLYIFNKKVKIVKLILITIILLFIWEKQIKDIITLVSFISAATALALRDVILNFFAGIFISIKKPFKIEDRIEIRDIVGNIIGDVVNINTLNFEILEVKDKEEGEQSTGIIIQIPNSKVFTDPIKNYTKAFKYVWNELKVKINLNADLPQNKKILYNIVTNNDIVKRIPKKMKDQLTNVIGNYRIYYNNLEPIIYTKLTEDYVELTIRYLAHPKKSRHIESQIWNQIYENAKAGNLDLYTTTELKIDNQTKTKNSSK